MAVSELVTNPISKQSEDSRRCGKSCWAVKDTAHNQPMSVVEVRVSSIEPRIRVVLRFLKSLQIRGVVDGVRPSPGMQDLIVAREAT